jgi:membrane protease YdiL (CAAX protease family)
MKNFYENFKKTLSYLLKYYLGLLLFTIFITVLEFYFKIKIKINCGTGLDLELKRFISTIFIAPILEELVFRYGLTYKNKEFLISLFFSIIAFIYWQYPIIEVINKAVFIFIFYLLINGLLFFINFKEKQLFGIYFSSIIFGLVHIGNYDTCLASAILIIINTIPQMFAGFCLAKLRLKSGIIYSIILHILINLIALGISLAMD